MCLTESDRNMLFQFMVNFKMGMLILKINLVSKICISVIKFQLLLHIFQTQRWSVYHVLVVVRLDLDVEAL